MRHSGARARWRWVAAAAGAAASAYGAYVAATWAGYGRPAAPAEEEADALLDRFMPEYDVVSRHNTPIAAPAAITLAAAREMDLLDSPVARVIVRAREVLLGATPDTRSRPHGLLAEVQSMGWGVLAEDPDREIVVGAVTKPWEANVTFRAVPADEFAAFAEPGYVKIVWNLRADPVDAGRSIFRTETRAIATDGPARARFRWYWSIFSPGMMLIRRASLSPLARDAAARYARR